jgi:hypothetical protein
MNEQIRTPQKGCKTKSLLVRMGFSSKAEHAGSKCKIHFLNKGKAICNPKMKLLDGFNYEHPISWFMYGDILPCPFCISCLKKRLKEAYGQLRRHAPQQEERR